LIWPQGSFAITSGDQTALCNGSVRRHEASPLRTSISMLIAFFPIFCGGL
jgi:hypothetical protein